MFPATTYDQALALLRTKISTFRFEGRVLTASLVSAGVHPVARKADGRVIWDEEPAYNIVFTGGKWGSETLRLANSSPERILAHWQGYIDAHTQDSARKCNLSSVPAGTRYTPPKWVPAAGDHVFFKRGMFGKWQGTIVRLYPARGGKSSTRGDLLADISCIGRNSKLYCFRRIKVATLTKGGVAPCLETL